MNTRALAKQLDAPQGWSAAYALMNAGAECYPFNAAAIQEAVSQAQMPELACLQEACESGHWMEAGYALRELLQDYWKRQADAVVRERQLARLGR